MTESTQTESTKTESKKSRTRAREELPPVVSREEAPGYLYFKDLDLWIYLEDALIVMEVQDELEQERFLNRRHGTRHLANLGCGGHLCRKAARDYIRKYNPAMQSPYRRKWERYDELFEILAHRHAREIEQARRVAA